MNKPVSLDDYRSLARPMVHGDYEFECGVIEDYLESDEAKVQIKHLNEDADAWIAAFRRLAFVPYEAKNQEDACRRIAAILSVLRKSNRARIEQAFDSALGYVHRTRA
jgi:hypothetical protein